MKKTSSIQAFKTKNVKKHQFIQEVASTCCCVIGLAAVLLLIMNGLGWLAESVGTHLSVFAGILVLIALGSVQICLEIPAEEANTHSVPRPMNARRAVRSSISHGQSKMPANTNVTRHLRAS